MEAAYNPVTVEKEWSEWWEAKGFFHGDASDATKPTYVCMHPPPNVTGSLHLGHALTNSIQDAIARW